MESIEMDDVQGLVLHGYKEMIFSRYILLSVTDQGLAKKWLSGISDSIRNGVQFPENKCLNIAFTSAGLKALGLVDDNIKNFSREFREGMVSPHRQRLLGDFDSSSPDNWNWGGTKNETVHILLLAFGATDILLKKYCNELERSFSASGLKLITNLDGQRLEDGREHFGFRDEIAQPVIEGSGIKGNPDNTLATGEFLMGYKNIYGVFTDTAMITTHQGDPNLLPEDASGSGNKDLGRNGTYLVLRQLKQDVKLFWNFMNDKTKNLDGTLNQDESIKLASKMIGRWPSGAPLVKFPDKDPGVLNDDNDFNYADLDKEGLKCPFGSHARRVNPRDTFEQNGKKESLSLTNRHRIIRRGRLYGEPLAGSPTNHTPENEVGMHFMCFNSDISRQFEFIQYTWANYPNFRQFYNDPDPIIGVRENPPDGSEQSFTIQDKPVSRSIIGLQRFVTTRGGSYFFFPSITAIRFLATI
jgi:Dyp-type peroxidase family